MDKEKILKAIYGSKDNPLIIGNVKIDCYVLDNNKRVISGNGMTQALGMTIGSNRSPSNFIKREWLKPYISSDLAYAINNPIMFSKVGNKTIIYGFEAVLLPQLCNSILSARRDGKIDKKDLKLAIQAEIIQGALSTVGIIALIDEATGYEKDRKRHELQRILQAYISEELLPWQKRFPDKYYEELFRLNGWNYTLEDIKKRPSCIGGWTNTIIYEQLPKGVLQELKEKTPKSEKGNRIHRFHQLLTEDIGNPHLNNQIQQILMLFKISDNMQQFWGHFKKAQERDMGQLKLPFEFDEQGHSIEPKHDKKSNFNKNIEKALSFNPNEDKD